MRQEGALLSQAETETEKGSAEGRQGSEVQQEKEEAKAART